MLRIEELKDGHRAIVKRNEKGELLDITMVGQTFQIIPSGCPIPSSMVAAYLVTEIGEDSMKYIPQNSDGTFGFQVAELTVADIIEEDYQNYGYRTCWNYLVKPGLYDVDIQYREAEKVFVGICEYRDGHERGIVHYYDTCNTLEECMMAEIFGDYRHGTLQRNIAERAYEVYKSAWCFTRGVSEDVVDPEFGVYGECYAGFEEFIHNEFLDKGTMKLLLGRGDYEEYLKYLTPKEEMEENV